MIRSNYRRGSDRLQYIGWMTNVEVDKGATKLGRRLCLPPEWPFMVLNQPGQGRSVYFAEDMGQAYFIAPYQYQRKLISNAVRWAAAANKPPIEVNAPLCVQAAFYTQERWQADDRASAQRGEYDRQSGDPRKQPFATRGNLADCGHQGRVCKFEGHHAHSRSPSIVRWRSREQPKESR